MGTTTPRLSAVEVKGLFEKLSNWGRWGKDDERGALNFITPQKRAAAGRLVLIGLAFVVAAAGSAPTPDELTGHCRDRLSSFKVPRSWRFVDELPMTASAKVQRAELRRVAAGAPA